MKDVFDLFEAINDGVMLYRNQTGETPTTLTISPAMYRRLVEIKAWEGRIGNLVIGCAPVNSIDTPSGTLCVVIDELFTDTGVVLS
jgi:hypothetical protein